MIKDVLKIKGIKGSDIEGVKVKMLDRIPDERGTIYHMLRNDDEIFEQFGEIYFSTVYPDVIKAWHLHKEMTLNYAVIKGRIKLVLYDGREDSPTHGNIMEVFMGPDNYFLISVPPGVWNGFKGMEESMVANCATIPHHPDEIIRKDPFSKDIPYDWSVKHG